MRRVIGCALALLLTALCACQPSPPSHSATLYEVFDTVTVFTAYTADEAAFTVWRDTLRDELTACHRLFDIYHTYPDAPHNLCALNAAAGGEAMTLDPRVTALLAAGEDAYTQSAGRVNILLGPVLRLWHDARTAADGGAVVLTDAAALQAALAHTSPDGLTLDLTAHTAKLAAGAAIDVGAIAKGYTLERTATLLEEAGCVGFINMGGNVRTLGQKPNGNDWTLRISHPLPEGTYSLDIRVGAHTAVSTSGDYQRYYTVDGVSYSHLIDPATGYPPTYMRAVSVVCDNAARADILSTALYTMPVSEALAFVDTLDGVEAVILDNDLVWRYSAGFSALLAA